MSYISGARSVADKQVKIASTKMDGIGPKKAIQVRSRLGISENIKIKELTKYQIDQMEQMIGQDHLVHWELKRGERADIERLISISRYRGIRHQDGLPLRGQRTHTNARTCQNSEMKEVYRLGTCLINHTDRFNSSLKFSFFRFFGISPYTYSRLPSPLLARRSYCFRLSRHELPLMTLVGLLEASPEATSRFPNVRSGGTKERCFLSVKSTSPMLSRSAYRGIEREDLGPEQVGLGYRAVSAVGVDRGRARALRSAAQMVPYEVSIGLILIVRLVSAFASAKAIARMFP
ncbi:LOW QUALITY PROTEIN: hypothetical protein V2J09_009016 [Rumex salicifolius]